MNLNSIQHQVIISSLLGDAGINKDKRHESYEFAERHSLKQEDYLLWKSSILNFKFKKYEKKNLCTLRKSNSIFKEYRNIFYKNGEKVVSQAILDEINELGLAIWHMDDGDYNYKTETIRLATHCFKLEGNKIIKNWFKEKWDIGAKITRVYDKGQKKEYFHIEMSCKNKDRYISLLKDYIMPSMSYKIGLDQNRRKLAQKKKKEYNKIWWANNENKRKGYYQAWKARNNKNT